MYQRLLFLLLRSCSGVPPNGALASPASNRADIPKASTSSITARPPSSQSTGAPCPRAAAAQPQPEPDGVTLLETEAVMEVVKAVERGLAAPSVRKPSG